MISQELALEVSTAKDTTFCTLNDILHRIKVDITCMFMCSKCRLLFKTGNGIINGTHVNVLHDLLSQ